MCHLAASPSRRDDAVEKAVLTASDQARAAGSPVDPAQLQRWRKRRWIVWGALAFAMLVVILDRFSLGAAADRVMADLGMTAAALGTLAAAYYYIYAGLQIPAGILTDRFGSRRMAAGGVAIGALGSFLFAAAPGMPVAYLGRFLVGLGVATVSTMRPRAVAALSFTLVLPMSSTATRASSAPSVPMAVPFLSWRG